MLYMGVWLQAVSLGSRDGALWPGVLVAAEADTKPQVMDLACPSAASWPVPCLVLRVGRAGGDEEAKMCP